MEVSSEDRKEKGREIPQMIELHVFLLHKHQMCGENADPMGGIKIMKKHYVYKIITEGD